MSAEKMVVYRRDDVNHLPNSDETGTLCGADAEVIAWPVMHASVWCTDCFQLRIAVAADGPEAEAAS